MCSLSILRQLELQPQFFHCHKMVYPGCCWRLLSCLLQAFGDVSEEITCAVLCRALNNRGQGAGSGSG